MISGIKISFALLIGLVSLVADSAAAVSVVLVDGPIATESAGGVIVHGNIYFGGLDTSAPLVLLFHQGGSNGRGEYGVLAPWLNENGFRAIAWDLRAGGDLYGASNRTKLGLPEGTPQQYCDAYSDLQSALAYVRENLLAEKVIVWGSSYSGALVFRLAGDYPQLVDGVLAFSPAAGGPMVACRARQWAAQLGVPRIVFKPASEMARESSTEQKEILSKARVEYVVVEDGIHGSSMLVDERTGHDMAPTRSLVINWLRKIQF